MKLMIVDGSAVVRTIIEQNLKKHPDFQILASVSNCQKLLNFVKTNLPDAIIFGNDFTDFDEKEAFDTLCNKMQIPLLFLTSNENEASTTPYSKLVSFINKPGLKEYTPDFFQNLIKKINEITENIIQANDFKRKEKISILCIGASTGGPSAVSEVLSGLGNNFPLPVLYTQHIEIGKDKALADWLDEVCKNIKVKLAKDGEEAVKGTVYMAPADKHLVINYINNSGKAVLGLSDEAPERYLRPAVNKLFKSAAQTYKNNVLAVLLTGMGADGADGCKKICDNGGWTIVEDKSTCAVFGMPAAAIEAGGAKDILPRTEIPKRILELVGK